jgi:betaine-aldehyde dehydrogenase
MIVFKQQQLYIDGRRVDATSGKTLQTINPANGAVELGNTFKIELAPG